MRLSLLIHPAQTWPDVLSTALEAERSGWDGAWMGDHFMPTVGDEDGPMNELWAYLAGLAAATSRLGLGALVCGITYRHPVVLLKQAITTHNMSGGRLTLGLGAGWHQREHDAFGIDYPDGPTRLDMVEETLCVAHSLLLGGRTTISGQHLTLRDAPFAPGPVNGHLPLLIGGGGEQRTMRLAAKYADHWNFWGTPQSWKLKRTVLDARCAEVGRDPKTIRKSCQALVFMTSDPSELAAYRAQEMPRPPLIGTPEEVSLAFREYAAAGVDEFIVPDFTLPAAGPERWAVMREIAAAAQPTREQSVPIR